MKTLIQDYNLAGKIDLIYVDPPFATNGVFKYTSERANTISAVSEGDIAYTDTLIGEEFLEYLRERLIFLKELLSDQGSIYLHTDYKIGHYIKIIMDEIFGKKCFRNDIARIKCNPKNFSRQAYGNIKDLILFYTKSPSEYIWNETKEKFTEKDIEKLFKKKDEKGRRYTTIPLHAPGQTLHGKTGQCWRGILPPEGRHWRSEPEILEQLNEQGLIEWSSNGVPRKKIYANEREGKKIQDIWEFKDPQHPSYPTEKILDLLKTIVQTSSNANSIVLDCFCGSGTSLLAAGELGRNWIGIDKSQQAIKICQQKLAQAKPTLFSSYSYELYKAEEKTKAKI